MKDKDIGIEVMSEDNVLEGEGIAKELTLNGDATKTDAKPSENILADTLTKEHLTKKQQFFQFLKFLAFSLSAGVIQLLSFELLYTWTACLPWWPSYLISIVLSVIWNFTFNRKFTFKSASNVPLAMLLVVIYYCAFIPSSVFGGDALEGIGWNGTLVTVLMMVINFVTEFFWDKYIVFNDKLINKVIKKDKVK